MESDALIVDVHLDHLEKIIQKTYELRPQGSKVLVLRINTGRISTSAENWHRKAMHVLWKSKLAARPEMGLEQRFPVSTDTQKTYDHCLELYEGESHNKCMRHLVLA